MKAIAQNIINEIIELYQVNFSNKLLATKFNLHRTTIQRILKQNNINLRKQVITSRKHKIINFNGTINSNNDAYLLGLIYSDGNLIRNQIDICLQENDTQILIDISQYVYGKINLSYRPSKIIEMNGKFYTSKPQCRFTITSKEITNNLKKIGLCENKSLKIVFPDLQSQYISHFIRGFFDGDGCILISPRYNYHNNVITIVSNHIFCYQLQDIVNSTLSINSKVYFKTENVSTFTITGNKQIKKFCDWIYTDADLKLDRKYLKYKSFYL